MDLGAYAKIEDYSYILKENNISIPRLRGLRLMKEENPISKEDIERAIRDYWLTRCEDACCSNFRYNSNVYTYSSETHALRKKYLFYDEDGIPVGVNWKNIHGKKRKLFKYRLREAKKLVTKQLEIYNKYCGRDNILYVHARIGGHNWAYYGGTKIAQEPWFIEKIDDYFDDTYCDIYLKI